MAPTGFHGLFGLFLASQIEPKHKYIRIGLVWGSVMPDLDLWGSAFIFFFTQNKELTLAFHRSITHSLIIMFIIIILGFIANLIWINAKKIHFPFIIGMILGMLFHVFFDLFYLDGVTLFWPIQPFGDRITLTTITYENLPPDHNFLVAKIIATLDGHFEILFYLTFIYFANKYQTDQDLSFSWPFNIKLQKWPMKLRSLSYYLIIQMLFFLLLAFISISWTFLDRDTFIIILYVPILPVYLLSGFLPLLMKDTIAHIGTNRH